MWHLVEKRFVISMENRISSVGDPWTALPFELVFYCIHFILFCSWKILIVVNLFINLLFNY